MSEAPVPEACRIALEAIQQDPLDLSPQILDHLRFCPACREARVQWLAQEEAPAALAPAGYFDRLPDRIQRKLPQRRRLGRAARFGLWAAASALLAGMGLGGYLVGRAQRAPVVEATLPKTTLPEELPEAPFQEEDPLSQLQKLDETKARKVLDRLEARGNGDHKN